MTPIPAHLLAAAPRVWVTVGPEMRVRVIDPKWRQRTIADIEAADARRLEHERAAEIRRLAFTHPEREAHRQVQVDDHLSLLARIPAVRRLLEVVCIEQGITLHDLVGNRR